VDRPLSLSESIDGHVTKTKYTTEGLVATYHAVEKEGLDAFNVKEVDPVYTDAMWRIVESLAFFNVHVELVY
jgi:hypothetical protein